MEFKGNNLINADKMDKFMKIKSCLDQLLDKGDKVDLITNANFSLGHSGDQIFISTGVYILVNGEESKSLIIGVGNYIKNSIMSLPNIVEIYPDGIDIEYYKKLKLVDVFKEIGGIL